MTIEADDMHAANEAARAHFVDAAEQFREGLEDSWDQALPGNHSPAEALLLAHLLTATDGYNTVSFVGEWSRLITKGWQTCMSYLAHPAPRLLFDFAFEARYDDFARQLAIIIDRDKPGERTAAKRERETAAIARGFRLMVLAEPEVLASPAACCQRIEDALFELMEDVLADAGIIRRKR